MRNLFDQITGYIKGDEGRRYARVAAFLLVGALLGAFLMQSYLDSKRVMTEEVGEAVTDAYVLEGVEPVRLSIPKIDLETPFSEPLGVDENSEIEVPDDYESVGWYKYGPLPGELGPAVVLGHVDSKDGPAVFWSLGQLEEGDSIFVERVDGTNAEFRVTRLERHPQDGFPTREVYGDIDHAGLRLITCSGTYDRSVLRYTHNLIVFAELVEPETTTETI